jgi:hypothetical protein
VVCVRYVGLVLSLVRDFVVGFAMRGYDGAMHRVNEPDADLVVATIRLMMTADMDLVLRQVAVAVEHLVLASLRIALDLQTVGHH